MKARPRGKSEAKATKNAYHWFQGASVSELRDRLSAAGPDARLEVRIQGESMTFRVVANGQQTAAAVSDINDSHLCPPICPG